MMSECYHNDDVGPISYDDIGVTSYYDIGMISGLTISADIRFDDIILIRSADIISCQSISGDVALLPESPCCPC